MKKFITRIAVAATLVAMSGALFAQNGVVYMRGTGSPPWGSFTNDTELDAVFGAGFWTQEFFQTANAAQVFQYPQNCYVFMEGGALHDGPMNAFVTANIATIEAWVNSGGNLFMTSAGWTSDVNCGFGGYTIKLIPQYIYASPTASAALPAHPIFNGPNLPVGTNWTGNYFTHDVIQGPLAGQTLINTPQGVGLHEITWGAGRVFFGGMTTTNWHNPSPNVENLRKNMHVYMYQCCDLTLTTTSTIDVLCNGDCTGEGTVSATLGAPPYTYDWGPTANNQTTTTATGLCAGTYEVTVTDAGSCTDTALVVINEPPALVVSNIAIALSNCGAADGSIDVTVSGGTPNYTYLWNTNATTNLITGLLPGNYCVTVTDANGCSLDTCVDVLINPGAVTMTLTATDVPCYGDCIGDATATPTSGNPPYTYQWGPLAGFQTNPTATGLCANTYGVTITDNSGCTGAGQITVNEPPKITLTTAVTSNYNGAEISCNGLCDGTGVVNGAGGTGGFLYQWSNAQTTANVTGLCAGTYGITITDLNGCSKDSTLTIVDPDPVVAICSADTTICEGTQATISVTTVGGTPFYTENWVAPLAGNGPHNVSPTVNTCYAVTVVDANGCTAPVDSVCVTVLPPVTVTVTASRDTICDGDDVILTATASGGNGGPYTYNWSQGGTTNQVVVTPGTYPNAGTYTVTASDGCSNPNATGSYSIEFYPTPTIMMSGDPTFGCEPLTVEFVNNTLNSASCEWNMGDGTIIDECDTFEHTYMMAGTYDVTLTVTSTDGCSNSLTYPGYVIVNPNPVADFYGQPQPTTIINTEIDFTDVSEGSVFQWDWIFYDRDIEKPIGGSNEQHPTFTFPGDTGLYPVELHVVTVDGCIDDTIKYIEINGEFNLFVPNAFTPNGDGLNETFFPLGTGFDPNVDFVFTIYDRWGRVMFTSESVSDPWDGTARDLGGTDVVQNGVYVWRIELKEATRVSSEKHSYVGHVTMLK